MTTWRAAVAGVMAACMAWSALAAEGEEKRPRPAFPLKVSEDRRHLVAQDGQPFLYSADTAWMIFLKLTEAEAAEYLADRAAKRFTAVQVQLTGFAGMRDRGGRWPFGGEAHEDFSRPNDAYFDHVERVVKKADELGLAVAIAPLWAGCCGEGWSGRKRDGSPGAMAVNGVEKTRAFGRYVGQRFAKHPNVLWILGGDNDPHGDREAIRALALGIREAAPEQLMTYHAASSHSSTDVWPADEKWIDVSMTYTYFRGFNKAWNKNQPDVYEVNHKEYDKRPARPFFLGESTYEGEHDAWGSALQARKQAYWSMLSGGCGHAYGSPNWNFPKNWREVMQQPGARSMAHFHDLFTGLRWHELVPDKENRLATAGVGEPAKNDLAVTAVTADGREAVTYMPSARKVTYDLSRMKGRKVLERWFDPRTGRSHAGRLHDARPGVAIEPPFQGEDWVLVLRAMP